jgi:arsenate reductase
MELWTNPVCSKSGTAESILTDKGIPFTTRRYLDDPPTRQELEHVLELLGTDDPTAIARPEIDKSRPVLDQLVDNPNLIQRPIAIHNGRAVVARPAEKVLDVL